MAGKGLRFFFLKKPHKPAWIEQLLLIGGILLAIIYPLFGGVAAEALGWTSRVTSTQVLAGIAMLTGLVIIRLEEVAAEIRRLNLWLETIVKDPEDESPSLYSIQMFRRALRGALNLPNDEEEEA